MKKNNHNKSPYLFVFGLLCLAAAGSYFYVEQLTNGILLTLTLLGLLSIFLTGYKSLTNQSSRRWYRLQWKKISFIIAIVFFSSSFLVGINYYTFNLPYRWDVTHDKQHTLTKNTIDIVNAIDQQVDITAFYVGLPPKYLVDLLAEFERASNGAINIEIINPIERIGYAAQFGNVINGKERKLIIRSGEERKDVDFSEYSLTEEQVINALVKVTREQRQVYFLTGHGEYSISNEENLGLSIFAKTLEANNMNSKSLMLGIEKKIPDDCDVLIIAGPHTELTQTEQTLINDYLNKGGDALFLIEHTFVTTPDKPLTSEQENKNPSLNAILNQWGINIGTDIVVDLSSHVGKDVGSPATNNYLAHKAITAGLDYTFYVRPRSISVLDERRPTIKLAPIVLSSTKESSWAETNRTLDIQFNEGIDIPGPVPISYVIFEPKEDGDTSDTRIIVFTDADFLTNIYINKYSNASMGLNIVNWVSELDYTVYLNPKLVNVERLDLTSKQQRMIAAILFLMPLLIILCGGVVGMRHRSRV
ncbi:MAG: GldG family protein [Pseudomonadales bacterium]|nr:GldG family protein [Pseudomonadales bacterium]